MKKIAIHSVPRSGSTWLGEIFNSCPEISYKFQPLFSYAFKDRLSSTSNVGELEKFFSELLNTEDVFVNQTEKRCKGLGPVFYKGEITCIVYKEVRYHHILENLLEKDKDVKVIGLIRNPLSVINSWLKAPKEFRKDLGWNELEEWCYAAKKNENKVEEFNGFEKWKEVAFLFKKLEVEYPERFLLVSYDDLLGGTEKEVQKIFDFCDLVYTEQTKQFLAKSSSTDKSEDAYSVFRENQKDNKWEEELHPEIIASIKEDLTGTELAKYF